MIISCLSVCLPAYPPFSSLFLPVSPFTCLTPSTCLTILLSSLLSPFVNFSCLTFCVFLYSPSLYMSHSLPVLLFPPASCIAQHISLVNLLLSLSVCLSYSLPYPFCLSLSLSVLPFLSHAGLTLSCVLCCLSVSQVI